MSWKFLVENREIFFFGKKVKNHVSPPFEDPKKLLAHLVDCFSKSDSAQELCGNQR